MEGHSGIVASLAFAKDGKRAVTGASDGTARLWDLASGKALRVFAGPRTGLHDVALSGDGRRILTTSGLRPDGGIAHHDFRVQLWDTATGKELGRFAGARGLV